jgi:putative AlgH/UPF0301 family transcriptional regulator
MEFIETYAFSMVFTPIHLLLSTLLTIILILTPSRYISLGRFSVALVRYFPPELALISCGDNYEGLKVGSILVATDLIPQSSMFHKSVILVTKHSHWSGSEGIILNNNDSPVYGVFDVSLGGPVDINQFKVLHSLSFMTKNKDRKISLGDGTHLFLDDFEESFLSLSRGRHLNTSLQQQLQLQARREGYMHGRRSSRERRNFNLNLNIPNMAVDALDRLTSESEGLLSPASSSSESAYNGTALGTGGVPHTHAHAHAHAHAQEDTDAFSQNVVYRVFGGHATWAPQQLSGELWDGHWKLVDSTVQDMYARAAEDLRDFRDQNQHQHVAQPTGARGRA